MQELSSKLEQCNSTKVGQANILINIYGPKGKYRPKEFAIFKKDIFLISIFKKDIPSRNK